MTPTPILAIGLAAAAGALFYTIRRVARYAHTGKSFDLGVVSTRWLSELRRYEPWTRS